MTREYILEEIRRTAAANAGAPLGRREFQAATGIAPADWQGRYWARWGDAVREAGLTPNTLQAPYDDRHLLSCLADLVLELGRFPVQTELKLKRRRDPQFPSHNAFARLGNRAAVASRLVAFCSEQDDPRLATVAGVCSPLMQPASDSKPGPSPTVGTIMGSVYLLKAGKHYKLGRSNAVGRRERELAIQLPTPSRVVHEIKTDDPVGIERYWHQRFAPQRLNGEWFALSPDDVAAFKRRRFM